MDQCIRDYHQNGFAILPSALRPHITEQTIRITGHLRNNIKLIPNDLRSCLLFERHLPAIRRGNHVYPDSGNDVFLIGNLAAFNRDFMVPVIEKDAIDFVHRILGSNIIYHFSNITMKRMVIGSGLSWHRDFPNNYISTARGEFVCLMICLDGMTVQNGATEFVPGSHHDPSHQVGSAAPSNVQAAICPPGSLVIIHPRVLHGGGPNTSGRHRRNLVVQWGKADDPLVGDTRECLTGSSLAEVRAWATR